MGGVSIVNPGAKHHRQRLIALVFLFHESHDQTVQFMVWQCDGFEGQIIRVQGRIRIRQPIEATTDGFLIYDSLAGTAGALRFREPTPNGDWQEFEYYREVARSGEMRLLFEFAHSDCLVIIALMNISSSGKINFTEISMFALLCFRAGRPPTEAFVRILPPENRREPPSAP